ncbi:MAG TPA: YdcF family protein [Armatimonadota bacterium]|nr:YdcF family protein [Armatimonadota bacterium]
MLGGGVMTNGTALSGTSGGDRLERTLELVRQGLAERIVFTGRAIPLRSDLSEVTHELESLRFKGFVDELRPARNTHEEAVLVSRVARERGWEEALLVTNPSHTRRATATFRRAGLNVVPCPSRESRYNLDRGSCKDLKRAVLDLLHEEIGWWVYRLRGWL